VINSHVLKKVTAVLPVTGGVVVCGVVPLLKGEVTVDVSGAAYTATSSASEPTPTETETHVAVHYDRRARSVRAFLLGRVTGVVEWAAYADLHCVALRTGTGMTSRIFDLATDKRDGHFDFTRRAGEARARTQPLFADLKRLEVITYLPSIRPKRPVLVNVNNRFQPLYSELAQQWPPFEPKEDGKPLLHGATIRAAQLAADLLAFETQKGSKHELRLYRGPEPVALGVIPLDEKAREFVLSPHGRMIAWTRQNLQMVMAATTNPANVLASVSHAGLHNRFEVRCDAAPFLLSVQVGSFRHQFAVANGSLAHQLKRDLGLAKPDKPAKFDRSLPPGWDATRFAVACGSEDGRFRALGDKFGQVLLLNRANALLAAFLIRREKAAAWTPAGGFWGDPVLIGGAPAPNAADRIGRIIQAECEEP
jgi:hypothetical protein